MEKTFYDEIEMKGSWIVVSFWDELNFNKDKSYELSIHISDFEKWIIKNDLLKVSFGYSSSSEVEGVIVFNQLIEEVEFNELFLKYATQMAKEILSVDKVAKLEKDNERLAKEYSELLHMYRLLQGAPVSEAHVVPLKQAVFSIAKAEVERVRNQDDEHAREVYQTLYTPFPKQANS